MFFAEVGTQRDTGLKPGGWDGQLLDCSCADAREHDRESDLGRDGRCVASRARRMEAELRALRVSLVESHENACLIEDGAAAPVIDAGRSMEDVASALDQLDPGALDGEALMGTVLALEGVRRKLDALTARTLGQLDSTGVTREVAGLQTKRWKAVRTHGSDATVARELRVARTLDRFSGFAEALEAGHISADHVSALDNYCNPRIVDALMELEADLVTYAKRHHYGVFVRHLRNLAALLDQDGAEPDCGDRDTARMAADGDGHLHVVMDFTGHNAVTTERIIRAETDRQYRCAVREQEATGIAVPDITVLRARAIRELLSRGADANPDGAKPAVEAIVAVRTDRDGCPTGVHSIDGEFVDETAAAVLLCDARLFPVIVDDTGNPLDVGRAQRFFTADQRRSLIVRDGGCIFAGCDQPAGRCDAHHEIFWGHGGVTDVAHGALLCPRHHGLVHGDNPWTIKVLNIADLPGHLAEQHRVRAASARLEPSDEVRVWESPRGQLFLAQNAIDHHGPAPPRRHRG